MFLLRWAALGSILVGGVLGLAACNTSKTDEKPAENKASAAAATRVTVTVTDKGYTPSTIEAKAGQPLTLVFKRTTENTCGEEVVFPEHKIRRKLPLNEEVSVELSPRENERIAFTCGMGMYKGSIVATN